MKRLFMILIALMTLGMIFAANETKLQIFASQINGKKVAKTSYIYVDNTYLFSTNTATGEYYDLRVEPGQHTIDVYKGNDSSSEEHHTLSFFVQQNKCYNVSFFIDMENIRDWGKNIKFDPIIAQQVPGKPWGGKLKAELELRDGVVYDVYGHEWKDNTQTASNIQEPRQHTGRQTSPQTEANRTKSRIIQSDVDSNIPQTKKEAENTYALIIANEDYQFVDPVNFASHDGEVFKEYCIKTLGIPEKQVRYCANASYGVISGGVDWLKYALDNFEGSKAIVYYCGHGIPDEKTGDAFIIPVDGKGTNTATCYSLNKLYTTLAATKAVNVTYFMDACFTGANKEGSMLVAARGVAREAKKEKLDGNAVVFSASSADETAMTYPEKGHGLFTYFLLKKMQETNGDVTYDELAAYINRNVKKEAFLINEKPQTPVVATSPKAASSWKSMKLK